MESKYNPCVNKDNNRTEEESNNNEDNTNTNTPSVRCSICREALFRVVGADDHLRVALRMKIGLSCSKHVESDLFC